MTIRRELTGSADRGRPRLWPGRAVAAMAALAFLAWPVSLPAQAASGQGFGLEVNGGFRALAGDELDGLDDGLSAHVLASYAWTTGWEAGIGAGISFHDPAPDVDGDLTDVVGFARYRFGVPRGAVRHLHPFVEGRAGFVRFSTAAPGQDDISQDGSVLGGKGGAEYWLTDEVGLTGGVGVEYLSLSSGDGLTERSGWSIQPQVGLKLRY